jgi:hypothetical protein
MLRIKGILFFLRSGKQAFRPSKNKIPRKICGAAFFFLFAVREGFEPSVQLPVRQFSKLFLSATQAPHRKMERQSYKNVTRKPNIDGKYMQGGD